MKYLPIAIFILLLLAQNASAQITNEIKFFDTEHFKNIAVIGSQDYFSTKINDEFIVDDLFHSISIDELDKQLGDKVEVEHFIHKAGDSDIVLFENKKLKMNGLSFQYEKMQTYILYKIELTSPHHVLYFNGINIQIGMNINEVFLNANQAFNPKQNKITLTVVSQSSESGQLLLNDNNQPQFEDYYITFEINDKSIIQTIRIERRIT